MHSLMMAQDILEAALVEAKKHNAKHINAISVKTGDGYFTESDSLQFCLEATTKGTIAEGARIEIKVAGTTAKCRECALIFPIEEHLLICPYCGDTNPEIHHSHEPPQVTLELELKGIIESSSR